MAQILSNSILSISVSEHGAELQSIQKGSKEYLWQGDARFWGRRSPVLFPTVGRVWNNQYFHEGKCYEIGQHGFARDMDFTLHTSDENSVMYRLESTPESKTKFPFDFTLYIGYQLEGNRIRVIWRVENHSEENMPFQIGAHPAFYLEDFNAEASCRGYFAFDNIQDLHYQLVAEKGCVGLEYPALQLDSDGLMPIDVHTFDRDAYVFDKNQLRKITLLSRNKQPLVSLEFDTPLVALWAPTATHPDCPFVCIEPWYGRCDTVGYEGEWKDREWMQQLAPSEAFEASYSIVIE